MRFRPNVGIFIVKVAWKVCVCKYLIQRSELINDFDTMRLFLIILFPFLWWYFYFYVIRRIEDEGHSGCAYVSNTSNCRLCRPCHFFLLEMSQHGAIEARSLFRILTNTVFFSMIKENNRYLWDWGLNYFELYVVIKCFYFMDTEIYTVKYYHSYLWLDKQCIFTVVHFQSLKCVVQLEKISVCMKWKHHTMESAWTIFIHLLQCI